MTAAMEHSRDQAKMQRMSHEGSDGSSMKERINKVGLQWRIIGENVAAGYKSVDSVMEGWMKSEGHRENILNRSFRYISATNYSYVGLGEVDFYWTQMFAGGALQECMNDLPLPVTTTSAVVSSTQSAIFDASTTTSIRFTSKTGRMRTRNHRKPRRTRTRIPTAIPPTSSISYDEGYSEDVFFVRKRQPLKY